MTQRVLVLNGPNLSRPRLREPEVYGRRRSTTWPRRAQPRRRELGLSVEVRQTDDEAELVGWLHEAADGLCRWCSTRRR